MNKANIGARTVAFLVVSFALGTSVLVLPGCKKPAEREAARRVNELLPSFLGTARKWDTKVHGDSIGALSRGRLRRVDITGENVQLSGLVVDNLTLQFDEVDVDTGARKLRNIGAARFEARISGERLDYSVRDRYPSIRDLRIALVGNKLQVTARPEVRVGDALDLALQKFGGELGGLLGGVVSGFRLGVPVTATGRLLPQSNTRLAFEPDRAKVSGVSVPGPVLDWLAGRLNTVVDLSGFAVPVRVRNAQVQNGFLILSGDIAPDDVLKAGERLNP